MCSLSAAILNAGFDGSNALSKVKKGKIIKNNGTLQALKDVASNLDPEIVGDMSAFKKLSDKSSALEVGNALDVLTQGDGSCVSS